MRIAQWARLQTPARCGLRWGAWYPVMALAPREVQLWVRGRNIPVARSLLEFRSTPPREWTVARTNHGSDPYLVCRLLLEKKKLPASGGRWSPRPLCPGFDATRFHLDRTARSYALRFGQ